MRNGNLLKSHGTEICVNLIHFNLVVGVLFLISTIQYILEHYALNPVIYLTCCNPFNQCAVQWLQSTKVCSVKKTKEWFGETCYDDAFEIELVK